MWSWNAKEPEAQIKEAVKTIERIAIQYGVEEWHLENVLNESIDYAETPKAYLSYDFWLFDD